MGITGLLPFLEKASRRCHVAEFRGCTIAIDTYCWLHKGAFGCAEKIVKGEDTDSYVLYCLKYLKMLKSYGIHPILVFDGQHLPAKQQTEEKRREQRKSSRKKVSELLRIGKTDEARLHMRHCIDITHRMAFELIKECRENNIDCIVAPYEADAQLAYLNIKKFVHLVITEDSDLLLFGCNKIIFKMDVQGFGTLVEADKINVCMKLRPDDYSFEKFRYMCILSGCDYLESLPGIGLKKALKFVSMTANPSIYNVLLKLPSYLKLNNLIVTNEYRNRFMAADATFQHQLVFDPVQRKLLPLHDPKASGTKEEFCKFAGNVFDNDLAFQMALGNVDPFTYEKYDDWSPDKVSLPNTSMWSRQYQGPNVLIKKQPKLVAPFTKNVQIDVQVMEQQKVEYDLKLEKELEIYKVMEHIPKKQESDKSQTSEVAINRPVNVPFLNKKKISQFERTLVNYEEPLTSRFFSSNSSSSKAESSTSNYDSLLSGISDYTKQRKSTELKDTVPTTEESETLLGRPAIEEKTEIIFDNASEVTVEPNEIENNVNISNLQDEAPDTLIHQNKRKQSSIFEGFGIPKKKCLKTKTSKNDDDQNESVLMNIEENILESKVDQDMTMSGEVEDNDNAESSTNSDKIAKTIPQPRSPILSSGQASSRGYNLSRRVKTARNQLNLRNMFENMRKNKN